MHAQLRQAKFLQWTVCLPAGVLLQIYSVWSSVCGMRATFSSLQSCDVFSGPPISTAVVASQLGTRWQRVSSTVSHIDATLTLAQQTNSDGVYLIAAVVM